METKVFKTKINIFSYIGFLLVGCSLILILQLFLSKGHIAFSPLMPLVVGIIFCYVGFIGRKFIFDEKEFRYATTRTRFKAKYDEINLLKTFYDKQTKSNNLLVFIDENNVFSFSSNFYQEVKLKDIYKELEKRCKTYIDKNELTVENELDW